MDTLGGGSAAFISTPAVVMDSLTVPRPYGYYKGTISRCGSMSRPGSSGGCSTVSLPQLTPGNSLVGSNEDMSSRSDVNGSMDEEEDFFERFLKSENQDEMAPFRSHGEGKEDHDRPRAIYEAACRRCGVLPSKTILNSVRKSQIRLKNHSLGREGVKPLCIALVSNIHVTYLDLEGNDLGAKGAAAVADVMSENLFILDLNLAENNIGSEGAKHITRVMRSNRTLRSLNLKGNGFQENDAKYFADLLLKNNNIKELCLSHNAFRERGGEVLADAIGQNSTLEVLDLSWNHLRLNGAMAIGRSLETNRCLKVVNLAWNGFSLLGCQQVATAMESNNTLLELDLSANRIDKASLNILMGGLSKNTTLEVLKLGYNPIYGQGVNDLLDWYETYMSSGIKEIDLTQVCIDEDFRTKLKCIQRFRLINIIHGTVVNPSRPLPLKPRDSIFDTPTDPLMVLFEYMKQSNLRLVDFFHVLDKDKSETITKQEFREGLQRVNIPLSERALTTLMKKLDLNHDGQIDFGEFVIGHKENNKKVGMAAKRASETKLRQIEYLRDKVRRLLASRKKKKDMKGKEGFVTAIFSTVKD